MGIATYIMCGCHNVDIHCVGLSLTLNIIAILWYIEVTLASPTMHRRTTVKFVFLFTWLLVWDISAVYREMSEVLDLCTTVFTIFWLVFCLNLTAADYSALFAHVASYIADQQQNLLLLDDHKLSLYYICRLKASSMLATFCYS